MKRSDLPPESGPSDQGARRQPGFLWQVYLGLLVILIGNDLLVRGVEWFQPLDGVDLMISLTSLTGLIGFVLSKALLRPGFWRIWLFIAISWDATHLTLLPALKIAGLYSRATTMTFLDVLIGLGVAAPLYVGLFCYGYRSDDLWASSSGG